MAKQEAEAFVNLGKHWFGSVWMEQDPIKKGTVRETIKKVVNDGLSDHGVSINRGWQDYDPVIRMAGKADTYDKLANFAASQPDGGKQIAAEFMQWAEGDLPFADLSRDGKAMAVITHIAEVGRGYSSALKGQLYPLMNSIAASPTPEVARQGWTNLAKDYAPALKYKQDSSQSFSL